MFLPVFYSLDITVIETANQYCCLQPADSHFTTKLLQLQSKTANDQSQDYCVQPQPVVLVETVLSLTRCYVTPALYLWRFNHSVLCSFKYTRL